MKTVLVEPLTITSDLLDELAQDLQGGDNSFTSYDSKPTSVEEWVSRVGDADQVILANTKMPIEVIEQAPNLKYINIAFTGVDHVPVQAAKDKGILVSNAAGYSDEGVAELVIGLTIDLLRTISEADKGIRKGGKAADYLGKEIAGRTVGIIGTGKIGTRVAEIFKAMGANLFGYNRSESQELKDLGLVFKSLDEVLKESDIITVHLPQNEETKDFITDEHYDLMKDSAILINCARGPIVNTQALAKALNEGKIAGAGIDVFDTEPPLEENHPLFDTPNTVLTPHVAYFTEEAMEKRAHIVFENAVDFLNGKDIKTLV
mgnify:CR=1 FL=1